MSNTTMLEDAVATTVFLTKDQMASPLPFLEVIQALNEAGIRFVLVGAHGLAGWIQAPRATIDVDVVVAARQVKKAVKALTTAFPELEATDEGVVVRLREVGTNRVRIDVMKPVQQPYVEALKHTRTLTTSGVSYKVPTLEMGLLMKFTAMTSPHRADEKKYIDAHDFILMVKNNPEIAEEELVPLANMIYSDCGKKVVEAIQTVRAGKKLVI